MPDQARIDPPVPRSIEDERRAMRADLRDAIVDALPIGIGTLAIALFVLDTAYFPLCFAVLGGGLIGRRWALREARCARRKNSPPVWGQRHADRPLSPYEVRLADYVVRQQHQAELWFAGFPLIASLIVYPLFRNPLTFFALFSQRSAQTVALDPLRLLLNGAGFSLMLGIFCTLHTYQMTQIARYLLARRDLARGDEGHDGPADARMTPEGGGQ